MQESRWRSLAGVGRGSGFNRSARTRRAALRHITEGSGHEVESARAQVDDAVIELLSPLLAAGPDHAHGKENPDLFRIASEIDDLARCIAWMWLELWEREHREMGEILHAILEDERAYWSSVYRRET